MRDRAHLAGLVPPGQALTHQAPGKPGIATLEGDLTESERRVRGRGEVPELSVQCQACSQTWLCQRVVVGRQRHVAEVHQHQRDAPLVADLAKLRQALLEPGVSLRRLSSVVGQAPEVEQGVAHNAPIADLARPLSDGDEAQGGAFLPMLQR